jgi:hypothetical protein
MALNLFQIAGHGRKQEGADKAASNPIPTPVLTGSGSMGFRAAAKKLAAQRYLSP